MIFRYGLQMRCSVINRGGSGGISGDLRRGVVESQKARDGCTSSCKDFRTNEGNPAPALCYLGQVVLQSSLHEHNTDLSVTNLQPQKESHWTKCVLDSSQWAVFCGQRRQKCNFWQKTSVLLLREKAMHINSLTSFKLWTMRRREGAWRFEAALLPQSLEIHLRTDILFSNIYVYGQ